MLHILTGLMIAAALGPGSTRRYRSTTPLTWWSRWLCRILGIRLQTSGTPHVGTAFFVANHISWLDIFCIAAVCPTHFLAKQEVTTWPLFGWLCRRAGTAFIQRGGENGAREAMEHLAWRLRQGERVLIFAEGTSTTGETVKRFYPRLFQAALLVRCPVQAIALCYPGPGGRNRQIPFVGDDALLPHLWRLLGEPASVAVIRFSLVHQPPHTSRDVLARMTHAEVSTLINSATFTPACSLSSSIKG
jgi:1-acyl-sn-glycerol-3-phosphate acyltransferase